MSATANSKKVSKKQTEKRLQELAEKVARRRRSHVEAPDWGEPISEAPESSVSHRAEAPDAGEGQPHEAE
jgi:hypothetical protein